MNIQDAARLAHEKGTAMHRPLLGRRCCIVPTNTVRGCLLVQGTNARATGFRYQPTLEDLLADDWEVEDPAAGMLHGQNRVDVASEPPDDEKDGADRVLFGGPEDADNAGEQAAPEGSKPKRGKEGAKQP